MQETEKERKDEKSRMKRMRGVNKNKRNSPLKEDKNKDKEN